VLFCDGEKYMTQAIEIARGYDILGQDFGG